MTDYSDSPDFQELIEQYLNGTISSDQFMELEEILLQDESSRAHFVRYCGMHSHLHLQIHAVQLSEDLLSKLETSEWEPGIEKITANKNRWVFHLPEFLGWVVAAGLLIGFTMLWTFSGRTNSTESEFAWLVNAQNVRWEDESKLREGIRQGTVLFLREGLAQIRTKTGVELLIEGPSKIEFLHAQQARLHHGKMSAKVPEEGIGFTVITPRGEIVDLGTEFGLSVAEDGATDVVVFKGEVEARHHKNLTNEDHLLVKEQQSVRLANDSIERMPMDGEKIDQLIKRAIPQPKKFITKTKIFKFDGSETSGILDRNGAFSGLTYRLPGTGASIKDNDPCLLVNTQQRQLELTTTQSDLNSQFLIENGEYLGLRLSELGFTGKEDFVVSVEFPSIPALKHIGQFGLYAGSKSDFNIRGGMVSKGLKGKYRQFLVNNFKGRDYDPYFVGIDSAGDDLRMTLERRNGKYSMSVENLTANNTTTLQVKHPQYLDDEEDLFVGLYGATPRDRDSGTIIIKEFRVTVFLQK